MIIILFSFRRYERLLVLQRRTFPFSPKNHRLALLYNKQYLGRDITSSCVSGIVQPHQGMTITTVADRLLHSLYIPNDIAAVSLVIMAVV